MPTAGLQKKRWALLLLPCLLLLQLRAQPPYHKDALSAEIEQLPLNNTTTANFSRARNFFAGRNWDSVLVYTMKQLSQNSDTALTDYCHYLRAISFKHKKLFHEANTEFNKVSRWFRHYYSVTVNRYEIALEQENYPEALARLSEIEALPDAGPDGFSKSAFYHNTGIYYLHQGRFDSAETFFNKSISLQTRENDSAGLAVSYMDMGNLYYEQYKDREAIPWFEKGYRLSKSIQDFQIKMNAAQNMAVVEENRKNPAAALAYRKEFEAWNDSLNNQNKIWALAQLEKKFALQQKQREVDVLETRNQLKTSERNGFIYASALLTALLVTGIYFYRQKLRQNRIIATQKKELDELNRAKDRLFSIVSHDLRSSVNALKISNTHLREAAAGGNMAQLEKLLGNNSAVAGSTYHLLDNLLHWALLQTEQASFYREPQHLLYVVEQVAYNYLPLMAEKQLRFANKVPEDCWVVADQQSLKIILRNVLDNAIKFSGQNGFISVDAGDGPAGMVNLVVEDRGAGMPEALRQALLQDGALLPAGTDGAVKGTGLGMQLCRSLAAKNGGGFTIESREGESTRIIISLPKNNING